MGNLRAVTVTTTFNDRSANNAFVNGFGNLYQAGEGNFGNLLGSNWIPALSSAGHVAFFADLTGTTGGTADGREGIALWSPLPKPALSGVGQIQPIVGGFQVRFPGIPGWDYVMERDEDLVPPWTRINPEFRANDARWVTLDDLGPGLPARRFYRSTEAP